MNADAVLKVLGVLAEGAPIVLEILTAAASFFKGKGDLAMAKRIEDILPARSESRTVQEELEAKK